LLVKVAIITFRKKCYTYPVAAKTASTTLKSNAQLTSAMITAAWNAGNDEPVAFSSEQIGLAVPNFAFIILGNFNFILLS